MASQRPGTHLFLFFIHSPPHSLSVDESGVCAPVHPPSPLPFTGSINSIGAINSPGLHDREHIVARLLGSGRLLLAACVRCIIGELVQAL